MNIDTRITLFGLRTFNFLYDLGMIIANVAKQGLSDFSAYIAGRYNFWHFLEGEIGPLPDSVVQKRSISNIQWTYNTSTYRLTHSHNHELQLTSEHPWLTAAIRMGNIEYDMDEFIRKFKWVANINIYPSKKLLLYTWSIHSGIWLSSEDNPILRVITHEGEQVDIPIYDNNNDDWRRLLFGENESDSDDSTVSDTEAVSESVSESEYESESESESDSINSNLNNTLPSSTKSNTSTSSKIKSELNIIASPILKSTDRSRIESTEILELEE